MTGTKHKLSSSAEMVLKKDEHTHSVVSRVPGVPLALVSVTAPRRWRRTETQNDLYESTESSASHRKRRDKETDMFDSIARCADFIGEAVNFLGKAGAAVAEEATDVVIDNPGTSVAVVATGALTGGVGLAYAPAVGALVSSAGFGAAGGTLSGAAASNAGLAALGGGSLASGGFGMAGGTAVVTGVSSTTGAAASSLLGAHLQDSTFKPL